MLSFSWHLHRQEGPFGKLGDVYRQSVNLFNYLHFQECCQHPLQPPTPLSPVMVVH